MLSDADNKILRSYLALAPDPENAFTCDELLGYIFGLAITPDIISPSEWQPLIFGGDFINFPSPEQAEIMLSCLMGVLHKAIEDFHLGNLKFPFNINQLNAITLEQLYEWVSGFEEALALRDEIWDPEEYPALPKRAKEELYQSLMTVQGLVDPLEVMEVFASIPDDIFNDTFPEMAINHTDREAQIQLFLLSSLPFAIETLMHHARKIEKQRRQRLSTPFSGKKYNIIKVDFRRKNK